MNFKDPVAANLMRDIIERIATAVVERLRPADRYAEVVSLDNANDRALILYPGEDVPVPIRLDVIRPASVGAMVRISGRTGDRYVATVVSGDAAVWSDSIMHTEAHFRVGNRIYLGSTNGPTIFQGTGSPVGVHSANVGSIYIQTDGTAGNCHWFKESGTGSSGWVPRGT